MSRPYRARSHARPRRGLVGRAVSLLFVGGVFTGGAYGALAAWQWATSDDVLPVRSIAVEGTSSDRAHELRAFSEVRYGAPLLRVDAARAERLVEEHPWVRDATVRLVPPDAVDIEVTERRASAALATPAALYLLDQDGTPFKRARAGDGLDLPIVTGVGGDDDDTAAQVAVALRALRAHSDAGEPGGPVSEVHMRTPGHAELVLATGTRVTVGDKDFRERFEQLERVLQVLKERSEEPSHVRLDDGARPERVAVRLRARPEMGEKPGS